MLKRGTTATVMGYTLELLAVADLNIRCVNTGGFAYLNPVPFTAHDAFVNTSDGWRTIQVKAAQAYRSTKGAMGLHARSGMRAIKSDILALVDLDHMLIRYVALGTPIPAELPKGVAGVCRFSSSVVGTASASVSEGSTIAKLSRVFSASTTGNNLISSSRGRRRSRSVSTVKEESSDRSESSNDAVIPLPPQSEVDAKKQDRATLRRSARLALRGQGLPDGEV